MSAEEKKTLGDIGDAWNKLPQTGQLAAISYINGYADGFIAGQNDTENEQAADTQSDEQPPDTLAEEQAG